MTDRRAIQVGDLVQQVKACCNRHPSLGCIATVNWIRYARTASPECCGAATVEGMHAGAVPGCTGVPIEWLKRIPPLDELEGTRTDEQIREPA